MTSSAVLVTGSRSLADKEGAEAWCKFLLDEEFRSSNAIVLVHGGAVGPDIWAQQVFEKYAASRTGLFSSHTIRANGVAIDHRIVEDEIFKTTWRWDKGDPGPLARNRYMIDFFLANYRQMSAKVLAFVDPTSKTRGTERTLSLAQSKRLPVTRKVWSPEG